MLSSISPLGERARATRWGTTVTAYLLGSLLGGLGLGALAALVGGLLPVSVRSSTAVTLMVGVLLLLLALNLVSERVSFSSVIQRVGVLRVVDQLGRRPPDT
jgi:hypothetical protein